MALLNDNSLYLYPKKSVYMKRFFYLFLSFCFVIQIAEAQLWTMKKYEVTAGFGPTFFSGDVGGFSHGENALGFKDISFMQTRANLNLGFKYRILENINVRFGLSGGLLKATDKRGSNEARRLEASTTFFEPTILGEYYFVKNKVESSYVFQRRGINRVGFIKSFDVYSLAGIGGMFYSVKGNTKLKNNANGFHSGGFAAAIPIGVGSKYIFSNSIDFGVEVCYRYIFSDYIDGYTSQYSKRNDVYYSLNFVVIYKINTNKDGR